MKVLKHKANKRLFLATPLLLNNTMMEMASPAETKEFLSKYKKADLEAIHKSKRNNVPPKKVAKNFNWDVEIRFMDEAQVREIAGKIGVDLPPNVKLRQMKEYVSEQLEELKPDSFNSQSVHESQLESLTVDPDADSIFDPGAEQAAGQPAGKAKKKLRG